MNLAEWIDTIQHRAKECPCGSEHQPVRLEGTVRRGALDDVPGFLLGRQAGLVTLIADARTWEAAGARLAERLEAAGVAWERVLLTENANGDIAADEATLVEAMLGTSRESEALLAIGGGTIHDIVRFAAAQTGRYFVSVPTAASVDGFVSTGAPLLIRGMKTTIQTASPEAIFADLDVLAGAPREMTAAGFADMLGKYTSLADWRFSRETAGEPFCPLAYELTEQALFDCVSHADEIAAADFEGLRILTEALIVSGLSMQLVDHSRPASGGEHHLSHLWEMALLRAGRRQILHGAKVGVASVIVAGLYRRLAELAGQPADDGSVHSPHLALFAGLPRPEELAALLAKVGGPSSIGELGITRELAGEALATAHTIRNRATGLRYANEHGLRFPLAAGLEE